MKKNKIICVVGPTASGKTGLGVRIAKKLSAKGRLASGWNGAEIVSADSRQVYKGLDIGTGKDLDEYRGIKYHLIDICEPGEEFNLFDWLKLANVSIKDIHSRRKIPIIVGGTGLYIQALTQGFVLENDKNRISNAKQKSNDKYQKKYSRKQLEAKSLGELQKIYYSLPSTNYQLDKDNPHRLIRAIEKNHSGEKASKSKPKYDFLQIGIKWPKEELNKRIDDRAEDWFKNGLLKEILHLLKDGVEPEWLNKIGLDYKIVTNYLLEGQKVKSREEIFEYRGPGFQEMLAELKIKIHQYAKRQMTWFKRFPEINWVEGKEHKKAEKLINTFLGLDK